MDNAELNVGYRLYTLWICDDTMRDLKHMAVDDGVSVAHIMRKLVDDYVQSRNKRRN